MSVPADIVWQCTPQDVANLLRARTKDKDGTETGAWSDETRPTLTEVAGIIELTLGELTSAIGGAGVPEACQRGATGTHALLAAMLVELSYFPEQVRSDRSAYSEYRSLYDKQVALLQECVQSGGAGADAGGVGSGFHNVPVLPATSASYAMGGLAVTPPLTLDETLRVSLLSNPAIIGSPAQRGRVLRAYVEFTGDTDPTAGQFIDVWLYADVSMRPLGYVHVASALTTGARVDLALEADRDITPYDVLSFAYGQTGDFLLQHDAFITVYVGYTAGKQLPSYLSLLGPWGDLPGDHWPEPENPANWTQPFQPPHEPPQPGDVPVGDMPASGETLP